jgi:hypothetical protein
MQERPPVIARLVDFSSCFPFPPLSVTILWSFQWLVPWSVPLVENPLSGALVVLHEETNHQWRLKNRIQIQIGKKSADPHPHPAVLLAPMPPAALHRDLAGEGSTSYFEITCTKI